MKTAIIGAGAAGVFLAINLKEMCPEMEICIFEKGNHPLRKVKISGGGRCNCTNSFIGITDLRRAYPRGFNLMKRLMKTFSHTDAYHWFEQRGVELTTQEDQCVFPASQSSFTIINCFLNLLHQYNVEIRYNSEIKTIDELNEFDFIAITTGGNQSLGAYSLISNCGHSVVPPLPSLYSLAINDKSLNSLMGTCVDNVRLQLSGTKLSATGTLLLTHWGISGPATLFLSSYGAVYLHENNFNVQININWANKNEQEISNHIIEIINQNGEKTLSNYRPFALPNTLWKYLLIKTLSKETDTKWKNLNDKQLHKLVNVLSNDTYTLCGRAPHKDEFVTCGGVKLSEVDSNTLESKLRENLFFAGEVLDIDGITGGFNFQAAWTTAYIVAQSISRKSNSENQ